MFRCVSTRRKFKDSWRQRTGSVTSVALATIARSRDRETRRFVVTALTVCWLAGIVVGVLPVSVGWFPFTGDTDSLICAVFSRRGAVAVSFVTSLVVGCLLPVAIGGVAYRKFVLMTKVAESASERCSRRQSSLVWLATRLTRRPSRFSVVSGDRRSVSSACEVVLRDIDVFSKRLQDDEVSQRFLYCTAAYHCGFHRDMLCMARNMLSQDIRLSVRLLSVTCRCYVIKFVHRRVATPFRTTPYGNILTETSNGGVECRLDMKKLRFSTNVSLFLVNNTRWGHSNRKLYQSFRMVPCSTILSDLNTHSTSCHYLTLNVWETVRDLYMHIYNEIPIWT